MSAHQSENISILPNLTMKSCPIEIGDPVLIRIAQDDALPGYGVGHEVMVGITAIALEGARCADGKVRRMPVLEVVAPPEVDGLDVAGADLSPRVATFLRHLIDHNLLPDAELRTAAEILGRAPRQIATDTAA